MEVQEGFIVGVYNYCDRWCETCRFTSRCRVFADIAKHEACADDVLRLVAEAPPHSTDLRETPGWLEELLADLDQTKIEALPERAPLPAKLSQTIARTRDYGLRAREWSAVNQFDDCRDALNPIAVIQWFSTLIGAKVHRAMHGLAEADGCHEDSPDHEGSAKVALIGIDRSIIALRDVDSLRLSNPEAIQQLIGDLESLRDEIEELIPNARQFVRPGFDELNEVARLEATDWS